MDQPPPKTPDSSLRLEVEGTAVKAHYSPSEAAPPHAAAVEAAFAALGRDDVALFPEAVPELVRRAGQGESFSMLVGGQRDARCDVHVSTDQLEAYATLTPSRAGKALGELQVEAALKRASVRVGLLPDVLQQCVSLASTAEGEVCLRAARGHGPVHGTDARLEPLVPGTADRRPKVTKDGRADYRELGTFQAVTPGTPILRVVSATSGTSGMTVTGRSLPAHSGKRFNLRLRDATVGTSPEDPDVLVARVAGRAVILADGAKVEPILQFEHVDVGTGNVNFDGSVVVKGDVRIGMHIEASGDIHVGGTVEAAHLRAGGAIEVGGGIIGHGQLRDSRGAIRSEAAQIHCQGNLSARFLENALVQVTGNVLARDLVSHCEILAGGEVTIGEGKGKGRLIGGSVHAGHHVHASVIGSPASVRTLVEVGSITALQEQLKEVDQQLSVENRQLREVQRLLHLPTLAGDKKAKFQQAGAQLVEAARTHLQQRAGLQQEIAQAQKAQVVATRQVYNNVEVVIAGHRCTVTEERNSVTFLLEDGEVRFR
jgi:hypothetical protein